MIDGVRLTINGVEYVVPALNFFRLKKLKPDLEVLGKMTAGRLMTDEEIEAFVRLVHAALSRNYPDMTLADVEELVDFNNLKPLSDAIKGESGLAEGGAAAGSGLTGASSTAT